MKKTAFIYCQENKAFSKEFIELLRTLHKLNYKLKTDKKTLGKIIPDWKKEVTIFESTHCTNLTLPLEIKIYTEDHVHFPLTSDEDFKWFTQVINSGNLPKKTISLELISKKQKEIAYLISLQEIRTMQKASLTSLLQGVH